jgi:hypothetical protein
MLRYQCSKATSIVFWLSSLVSVYGAIDVVDGPADPVYPEEAPDPWIIEETLTPNGTLTINNGSRVEAGILELGGRVIVTDMESVLQADLIDFQGTLVNNLPRSDVFVQAGTAEIGAIEERSDTTMFLRGWDFGTINVSGPGGLGENSTTVISLETGGSFNATGNQSFGGDQSSFTLGPGGGDQNVTVAKARVADAAMSAISQFITSQTGDASRGFPDSRPFQTNLNASIVHQTNFKVTGDVRFGGILSDLLILLTEKSGFAVTGNLSGARESSIATIVSIDSTLAVGGTASLVDGGTSSSTVFLGSSEVNIGGDWILINGPSSVSSLSALESQILVGGDLKTNAAGGSAAETTFENSTLEGGGDYTIGGPQSTSSAISFSITQSTIDLDGSLLLEISTSSVMSGEFNEADLILGGEFGFRSSGEGGSTDVLSFQDTAITTGGSFVLDSRNDGTSSSALSASNLSLNVGEDFRIHRSGNRSDNTTLLTEVTGSIQRDLLLDLGAVNQSTSSCVLNKISLSVGRDVIMTTGRAPADQQAVSAEFAIDIGRDFVLGPEFSLRMESSTISTDGSVRIGGRLLAKDLSINGNLHLSESGNLQLTWTGDDTLPVLFTLDGNLSAASEGRFTAILQADPPNAEFTVLRHTGPEPLTLPGRLEVYFAHGFQNRIEETDTITLIRADQPIQGAFANAVPGERFTTADGRGSFQLEANEAGTVLSLAEFQPANPPAPLLREVRTDSANGTVFLEWTPFGNGEFYEIQTRSDLTFGSWTTRVSRTPSFATSANVSVPESANTLFIRVIEPEN